MHRKTLLLLPLLFLLTGCTPEMQALFHSIGSTLLFVVPLVLGTIVAIFLMNKIFVHENGRTNNRTCAIVGVLLFPVLFLIVFTLKFGIGWVATPVALGLGALIGWFSYVLDELMEEFWECREVTLTGTVGLIFGGWMIVLMFSNVWMEGSMFVTHHACASRVVIDRYTHNTDSDGDDYYTWNYYTHVDRVTLGTAFPVLREGEDYRLGTGARGERDRVSRQERYRWIGGQFYSESDHVWRPFRWLLLNDNDLRFSTGGVQLVRSNFYGRPIENGGDVSAPLTLPVPQTQVPLPSVDDLPPAQMLSKVTRFTFTFIGILFTEEEYRPFLWFLAIVYVIPGVLAIWVPPIRKPYLVFLVTSSVVIFLVMLVIAARTGAFASGVRAGGGGGFAGRSRGD